MIKGMPYELKVMAITEKVPNLIWAPDFFFLVPEKFGPNESWSPRNLVPTLKSLYGIFMQGPTFLGTKFLQAQSFQGPKMSGAQMRLGTISVTAP